MNEEKKKQEFDELMRRYEEAVRRLDELLMKYYPVSSGGDGERIERPKGVPNASVHKEIEEAKERVDRLREEVDAWD